MAELDLNKVVQKYQQKLANADLAASVAEVRADQAESDLAEANKRIEYLEGIIAEKDAEPTEEKAPSKK